MKPSPFVDQPQGGPRADRTRENFAVEGQSGLLPLILGMKVRHTVLLVEHPDHDPEEGRDDRHRVSLLLLIPAA
jgi:hypothetical protein